MRKNYYFIIYQLYLNEEPILDCEIFRDIKYLEKVCTINFLVFYLYEKHQKKVTRNNSIVCVCLCAVAYSQFYINLMTVTMKSDRHQVHANEVTLTSEEEIFNIIGVESEYWISNMIKYDHNSVHKTIFHTLKIFSTLTLGSV